MAEKDNIPEMRPTFDAIRRTDENNKEYWSSRDLCNAMGYSTNWKFQNVINKAIAVANQKGMKIDDHFNQTVDMVKLGSGAYRKVNIFRLSRMACMIIAENADGKKPLVQQAREYFSQSVSTTELIQNSLESNILLYKTAQGETRIEVIFNNDTFWMSQKRMADLFGVDRATIAYHLSQIYESGELTKEATCRKIQQVQLEGERDVERTPLFYNLDVIIAVGYRVNSYQATQFRIWATSVLKEFIIKGYVLDDERLKQGKHFGKDYFDDLLERIREIRTSERRYYQKITDVYAECSADYDAKSESTQLFFKMVQNMMHLAVTHHTAAEIVYNRADAEQPHMGLTTWKKAPNGRVQKSDTIVAKNYLSDTELNQLNGITTSFLDFAETRAQRHIITTMEDWRKRLAQFLAAMDYEANPSAGTVSQDEARAKAYGEYEKYKLIQDRSYISDFDRFNDGDDDMPLLPFDLKPKET
ncbi:RhuM family protein [Prevotella sp.]|uniref:RhuM family protein n=1 Tax=Prevotella sp. TaxID=59823 RepID=UPI003F7F36AE